MEKIYVFAFAENGPAHSWVRSQVGSWVVEQPAEKAALGRWLNHTNGVIAPAPNSISAESLPKGVWFADNPWAIETAHMMRSSGDIDREVALRIIQESEGKTKEG